MADKKLSELTDKVADFSLSNLKIYIVDENSTPISEYGLINELISYLNSIYVVLSNTDQEKLGSLVIGGQAHGGNYIQSFSASTTFDAENGNNQEMVVTASTTIGVSNELPGTYIFTLEIDSAASPEITIGASFGSAVDNNATLLDADNDINIITLVVRPNDTKYYTINTITA